VSGTNISPGYLRLVGDTTLSGPGSVVLNGGLIGTNGNYYTVTSNVPIQGYGEIGSNVGADYQNLDLTNNSIINANSGGNTLTIDGDGPTIINAGLFEATNGGTLNLATSFAINNQNGMIVAGNGSAVNIINTDIEGGTLTTQGTGTMQTVGSVTLDASTLGAITLTDGSTYLAPAGTLTSVTGQLNLGTSTGSTLQVSGTNISPGYLRLIGDTTLSGPPGATVILNGGLVGTNGNFYTLTNNVLIQGYGVIGSNVGSDYQNLDLNNTATINANSNGNPLSIQGAGTSIVNTGLFEATNGGILNLATTNAINNAGGNITATGAGSMVNVSTTIQGGTLNTTLGGVMQTAGTAVLDGLTNGAITISDGSTYTAGAGTYNDVLGTLNLGTSTGGTLALSGTMRMVNDVTLSGPGSLTLSGAQIGTNGNYYMLTNNSTIQGNGLIGANVGELYPNDIVTNNGVMLSSGGTLTLAGNGTLTNNGTMHATAGTTLESSMLNLAASTYAANSLLTGTYIVDAGATLQINALGNTGGEIVNNSATIILNGVGSNFFDGAGLDALSNFNNNTATGSFTIQSGRNFTSPGDFANAGTVTVGNGSTLTIGLTGTNPYTTASGGTNNFNQSAGSLKVNGTLAVGTATINAGTVSGGGTIAGNVSNVGGTVTASDPGSPDILTIIGNYTQGSEGILEAYVEGSAPGTGGYSQLQVGGTATLDGTLDVDLIGSFIPTVGENFFLVESTDPVSGTFPIADLVLPTLPGGDYWNVLYNYDCTGGCVDLTVNGPVVTPTPEPSIFLLLAMGLAVTTILLKYRNTMRRGAE
jgi:hypothetical protein